MGDVWRLLDRWDSVAMHGPARSSASVATMGKSIVKSEGEMVIEGEIGGLEMALGVFASMGNWLGVSRFVAAVCKRGRQPVTFKVLTFMMKIQGMALIGCAWQWAC